MNQIDVDQQKWSDKIWEENMNQGDGFRDSFINLNNIWYWMHTYCLDYLSEFFLGIPKSTFLTVGDGYCGREGIHIKRFGHYVHASDLQSCWIKKSFDDGLLDAYSQQNIYNLTFEDSSFDYVVVKESLHHMSMPYKGLYEMFRVAKKGIILIEPSDESYFEDPHQSYELSGNYMHCFNSRDLIKAGLSFGFKAFVMTFTSVLYGEHNNDTIAAGLIEEEKKRLMTIAESKEMKHRPLIVFFFLKDESLLDIFKDARYRKIKIIPREHTQEEKEILTKYLS